MVIVVKDNGFRCEVTQPRIKEFNRNVEILFPDCKEIEHFYYGDVLVMTTVRLMNGDYGHFNIMPYRVSFNGHTCSSENYKNFEQLTLNDECHQTHNELFIARTKIGGVTECTEKQDIED